MVKHDILNVLFQILFQCPNYTLFTLMSRLHFYSHSKIIPCRLKSAYGCHFAFQPNFRHHHYTYSFGIVMNAVELCSYMINIAITFGFQGKMLIYKYIRNSDEISVGLGHFIITHAQHYRAVSVYWFNWLLLRRIFIQF